MREDQFRMNLVDAELVAIVINRYHDDKALSYSQTRPVNVHLLLPLSFPERVQNDLLLFRSTVEVQCDLKRV